MRSLEELTSSLLFQGLAKSTRRTYTASQHRFLSFCYWSQQLNDNGSPLPANERTLMLYAAYLSRTLKATSIKVYLAGVRSLHIENGFGNPLANCLRLERVLRGIKRIQGTGTRPRLPITVRYSTSTPSANQPYRLSRRVILGSLLYWFLRFSALRRVHNQVVLLRFQDSFISRRH